MEKIGIKNFEEIVVKNVNCGQYKSKKDSLQLIRYIFGKSKSIEKQKLVRYTGGYGVNSYDPDLCCGAMYIIKKLYRKTGEDLRHVYHIVVSFPEYIKDTDTIKLVAIDICEYFYKKDFQCVYAIHENEENLHIHIVVNSTNFITGKQVNLPLNALKTIKTDLQKIAYWILKEKGY